MKIKTNQILEARIILNKFGINLAESTKINSTAKTYLENKLNKTVDEVETHQTEGATYLLERTVAGEYYLTREITGSTVRTIQLTKENVDLYKEEGIAALIEEVELVEMRFGL